MPYVNSPTKNMCLRLKWRMKSTYASCPAYKNVNAKSIICFTAVVDDFFLRRLLEFEIADAFFLYFKYSYPILQVHQSDCICLSFRFCNEHFAMLVVIPS